MPPLLDLIAEREAAAAAAAETLREQIAKLTHEFALVDTELAELAITRKTLSRLTGHAEATAPPDTTIAGAAYQKILAAFATTTSGMRAKDVCLALGLGTTAKDTEGIRAKLKRLVARQNPDRSRTGTVHTRSQDTGRITPRTGLLSHGQIQIGHTPTDQPLRRAGDAPQCATADRAPYRTWRSERRSTNLELAARKIRTHRPRTDAQPHIHIGGRRVGLRTVVPVLNKLHT